MLTVPFWYSTVKMRCSFGALIGLRAAFESSESDRVAGDRLFSSGRFYAQPTAASLPFMYGRHIKPFPKNHMAEHILAFYFGILRTLRSKQNNRHGGCLAAGAAALYI